MKTCWYAVYGEFDEIVERMTVLRNELLYWGKDDFKAAGRLYCTDHGNLLQLEHNLGVVIRLPQAETLCYVDSLIDFIGGKDQWELLADIKEERRFSL